MHGKQTAAELGKRLGITGEAARQQLNRLAAEGQVRADSTPAGVGRPRQQWSLTPEAQSAFPDTHASLTVQILESVRSLLGDEALDRIIDQREQDTRILYEAAMSGHTSLRDRVAALAELRSAEGYMAAWEEAEDGSLLLIENHCPICAAASLCQGFCRTELALFRSLLGPGVTVERAEHIIEGARRCAYIIKEA
ncbi:putative ArsR family transcriptional regulator [Parvibaculum indicum]|uniref:helix-turn-helix transcriptional regulator n=1 Tax=Parvibaculum indicum TaxID=562969 RepID=UPI001FE42433|nr:metalloregulator ArsR/SmtB family transcription factor [Parvibaculum indicum]NIJ43006.1 putative ArsR family transcriptional regulator [Parvibaculum indicum]